MTQGDPGNSGNSGSSGLVCLQHTVEPWQQLLGTVVGVHENLGTSGTSGTIGTLGTLGSWGTTWDVPAGTAVG